MSEQEVKFTEVELQKFDENDEFTFEEQNVTLEDDLSHIAIIDNLPIVPEDKVSKLKLFIKKKLTSKGGIRDKQIFDVHLPVDESKKSTGFAFVALEDEDTVNTIIKELDGKPFDKKHNFKILPFGIFEKYQSTKKQKYQEYEKKEFKNPQQLFKWMDDEKARDQFAIRFSDTVKVVRNDTVSELDTVFEKSKMSDAQIRWSPHGSYMVTFHSQGIALRGGENFESVLRFSHRNPVDVHFSPNERYIVIGSLDKKNNLSIWDAKFEKKLRVFDVTINQWPFFKWSHDEKYFARIDKDRLYVYETTTFKLVNKRTFEVKGIKGFEWCPTKNVLSYWVEKVENLPAKIAVVDFPSMKELRNKTIVNLSTVALHWHPNGNYLACHTIRTRKSHEIHGFEIFRVSGKSIPVESREVKDKLIHLAWEPKGSKLSIIHGKPDEPRKNLSIYTMDGPNESIDELFTVGDKQIDNVFWSPTGRYAVLAYTLSSSGILEFWDFEKMESFGSGEHFLITDLSWSPSGRFISTSVTSNRRKEENGFIIWNFIGRPLFEERVDELWQFNWRPKPPTPLTTKEEQSIIKNIGKKKKKYVEREKKEMEKIQEEAAKEKQKLYEDWLAIEEELIMRYNVGIDEEMEEIVEVVEEKVEEVYE